MKPTVPENGTVLSTSGDMAVVILKGGKSCKGCGAAKIGLCRASGNSMVINVRNTAGALAGNMVQIGIDPEVQTRAFLLAYIVPLLSFTTAAIAGQFLGALLGIGSMDVILSFSALAGTSLYTFRKLRILDHSSTLVIKRVLGQDTFSPDLKSEEETRYEGYSLIGR